MTSSLVGSEMCIRDRRSPIPPAPAQLPLYNCLKQLAQAQSSNSFHRSLPVSYTHLTLPTICSV
eukprot:2947432-Prorocentrum_lima.AAC.1